ncbi:MAG: radical SAM protein [Deltaproteobacteria bacterium]|nr:radical SAM protein [Deltaproteobacteria bacterium]
MATEKTKIETYQGFEQGPIRPPSEAQSLLIMVSRNCPWNRCTFCPVYKGSRFSLRPAEHVKMDIDAVHRSIEMLRGMADKDGSVDQSGIHTAAGKMAPDELQAFNAAVHWMNNGMQSVFIQDANSLIIKPHDLIDILRHLKKRFPWVERITSYARSHTIVRIKENDLTTIGQAGLNRIHIGLESGSDDVLKMVKKGATKDVHIKAGQKVKKSGIELSEYVMPGLGGKALSRVHALETADALNRINPDFIRLRSLAIPNSVELFQDWTSGKFEKCTDLIMAEEILLFLESLDGITSFVKSDHILNLFEEVEGQLPDAKQHMMDTVKSFLALSPKKRTIYQVGRRLGLFSRLDDLENRHLTSQAEQACDRFGITPDNVDTTIDELMKRFI